MKVNTLNSTNFGALYCNCAKLNTSQFLTKQSIAEELFIRHLPERISSMQEWEDKGYDFVITPADNNFVTLSVVHRKEDGTPNFKDKMIIGNYNSEYPFKKEDVSAAFKENTIMTKVMIALGTIFIAAAALLGLKNCSHEVSAQTNKEIPTVVKSAAKSVCTKVAQFK